MVTIQLGCMQAEIMLSEIYPGNSPKIGSTYWDQIREVAVISVIKRVLKRLQEQLEQVSGVALCDELWISRFTCTVNYNLGSSMVCVIWLSFLRLNAISPLFSVMYFLSTLKYVVALSIFLLDILLLYRSYYMFVSMIPYHNSVRINSLVDRKNALATRFKYCKLTVVVTCCCWMLEVSVSLFLPLFPFLFGV